MVWRLHVSAKCEVCGKSPGFGSSISRRGKAKYLGGVGRKITGISKRRFQVNLQRLRVELPNGTRKRMRVCAQCLRGGKVRKRTKRVVPQAAD
ncbi:MAG: 50S ribosomal protein L28 [Planctomycetes bacterium DG_20]|nr:MAG: 50S ribosomal protein L28 [Planctomycetes bacterium DG_20]